MSIPFYTYGKMFLADNANFPDNIPEWNVLICVILRDLREITIYEK